MRGVERREGGDAAGKPTGDTGNMEARDMETTAREASLAGRGRVLLAEDNLVNRKLALLQLAKLGCVVDAASDGQEALARLAEEHYAVVLMDCNMPLLDGYEATRMIRAGEAGTSRRLPVIAMTASEQDADRERCFTAGMDDYVTKPVTLDKLHAILDRWLPAAGAADEPLTAGRLSL